MNNNTIVPLFFNYKRILFIVRNQGLVYPFLKYNFKLYGFDRFLPVNLKNIDPQIHKIGFKRSVNIVGKQNDIIQF